MNPWTPLGLKIMATASVEETSDGPRFRIRPEVIISWGINDTTPGIPKMERRVVADAPRPSNESSERE